MVAFLHHIKKMLFRRPCHGLSLTTDAYADDRTHHCQDHFSSTTGYSLSTTHRRFSLGSDEIDANLGYKAVLKKEKNILLNRALIIGEQFQDIRWGKTREDKG